MKHNTYHYATGIYIDGFSRGVVADNNTSFQNYSWNYLINGNRFGRFTNNIGFNNNSSAENFQLSRFSSTINVHQDLVIKHNTLLNKTSYASGRTFFYIGRVGDLDATVVMDSNYYARPLNDGSTILVYLPATGSKWKTLADWQAMFGQDAHSGKSPVSLSDSSKIDFYINITKVDRTITLPTAMVDITGRKVVTDTTISAFTSVILMEDPDPDPLPPNPPIVTTNDSITVKSWTREIIIGGDVVDPVGTVSARGICWGTSPSPNISGSHTHNGTGTGAFTATIKRLTANTVYYLRAYATNESATGYGYEVMFRTPKYSAIVNDTGQLYVNALGKIYIIE
jgi:hypothetical protein